MNETFSAIVRQAFHFLEDAGFRFDELGPTLLKYQNEKVFVMVERDPRSGETDVLIGLQVSGGQREDRFSLSTILSMENASAPEAKIPFQVYDQNRLPPFIKKLADDTKAFARSALTGDRMYFRRLRTFRTASLARGYNY